MTFKPRDRVYHYGQQWPGAQDGTGTVVTVQRDPRPGFTEILVWWDKPTATLTGRHATWINVTRLYHANPLLGR